MSPNRSEAQTDWTSHAACAGRLTNMWFPEAGDGAPAKAICATCPVAACCLTTAIARHETHGIWGGAGGDLLRGLARAYRSATHDPGHIDADCTCGWCKAATRHFTNLAGGHRRAVSERNGPGATHARRITYNRGCRCEACRFAATAEGQALAAAGIDPARWFNTHDRPTSRRPVVEALRQTSAA